MAGDDVIHGLGGRDFLCGFSGNDRVVGGGGSDTLSGDGGDDVVSGGGGFDFLLGRGGVDVLNGGAGFDLASCVTDTTSVVADLTTGTATGGYTDTFTNIEDLEGGQGMTC